MKKGFYSVSDTYSTSEWEPVEFIVVKYRCKNCGVVHEVEAGVHPGDFCPNCGFRMRMAKSAK